MDNGLTFTPSFAPGLYHEGDGKDLGHILEFKSEVQLSLDLPQIKQVLVFHIIMYQMLV